MPASPSLNSGKWKRRKRNPQIAKRSKHEDDVAFDEENEEEIEDDDETQLSNVQEPEIVSNGGDRISEFPAVVKRTVDRPHSLVTSIVALERGNLLGEREIGNENCVALENVSYGQLQAVSVMPAEWSGFDQENAEAVAPPKIAEAKGVVKRFGNRVHVVPMYSDWFSPTTVHRLERQMVPHFFSGKSPDHMPEKYMECRNSIVAKYMENPEKSLTAADCQGLISGVDNKDLSRIIKFLDHWGIINYYAVASMHVTPYTESYLKEEPNGEVNVPSAALKSIDSLIKFDRPKCKLKAVNVYSSTPCHRDEVSDLESKIRERLSETHCHCCSKPVPIVYFQSQKEVDVLLCSDCFHEGRFVIGHSSLDFVKIDSANDYSDQDGDNWTDQETLLLLDAMEIYNENWNEIAEHVTSKSKAQCILHFLRLHVVDRMLEDIEVAATSISSNIVSKDVCKRDMVQNGNSRGSCLPDIDSDSKLPFATSPNPVMAMVAFLASAVGPRVAAACARAALTVMADGDGSDAQADGQDNRMTLECLRGGNDANSVQLKEDNSVQVSRGQNKAKSGSLSAAKVKAAAKAGLAAAATKTKLFADHEEREIQRLSANIINYQFKRLEVKLKQFAELEGLLMKECEQVERGRQKLAAERGHILSAKFGSSGAGSPVSLPGVASTVINCAGSGRQQSVSASSPQANISRFNNQQPVHPHMPFMPREQSPMYGFGPRIPVTTIQSCTLVAPPNGLFNSRGNGPPSLNHTLLRPVSRTSSG